MMENDMGIVRGRSTVGSSNLHMQFTPKYRRDVYRSDKVIETCKRAFGEMANRLGVKIHACEFGPDHCHLFLGNCMKYSVPYIAQMFKGYSSWVVRRECMIEIKEKLWGKSFWSDGYFHEYIGRFTNDAMKYYIERQQDRHWRDEDYDYKRYLEEQREGINDETSLAKFM